MNLLFSLILNRFSLLFKSFSQWRICKLSFFYYLSLIKRQYLYTYIHNIYIHIYILYIYIIHIYYIYYIYIIYIYLDFHNGRLVDTNVREVTSFWKRQNHVTRNPYVEVTESMYFRIFFRIMCISKICTKICEKLE